jgi:hypothetical protein
MASPQENRHSRMHVHARSVSFPVMPIASAARVLHATTPRRVDQQRERHVKIDDCKGIRDHDLRGWHGAGPGGMCDQSGRGGIGDDGGHAGTATELSGQLPRDSQSLHGVRAQQQRPHRQGLGTRRVPSVRRLVGRPRELGRFVRGRCLELQRQYRLSSALLTWRPPRSFALDRDVAGLTQSGNNFDAAMMEHSAATDGTMSMNGALANSTRSSTRCGR